MREALAITIGLVTGGTMAVAVSCVWVVLLLPARVQDRFQAGSPRLFTWAVALGLMLSAAQNALGFRAGLPSWAGAAVIFFGGAFVGMLASALGEILEVVPVLLRRLRLGDPSAGIRWVMLIGKGLGALLGCLVYPIK